MAQNILLTMPISPSDGVPSKYGRNICVSASMQRYGDRKAAPEDGLLSLNISASVYSAIFHPSMVRVSEEKFMPSLMIFFPEARNGLS